MPDPNAACARCGGSFHCGAGDAAPCACTGLRLSADVLATLRRRYDGCLCPACLQAHAAAPEPQPRDNGHAARE